MKKLSSQIIESGYRFLAFSTPYNAWDYLQQKLNNQWLAESELKALRLCKLRKLINHSYDNVPFYRKLFESARIQPSMIQSFEDLAKIPVIEKSHLIKAWDSDDLGLDNIKNFELTHTSGTTGPCLFLPSTKRDMQLKYGSYLRQFYTAGWSLGVPSAALHYSGHPEFGGKYVGGRETDSFALTRKLAFRIAHRRRLLKPWQRKGYVGNESLPQEWYEILTKHRPYLLESMDFDLLALYRFLLKHDLSPPEIPVIFVLATLSPALKRRLERFFGAKIYNRYGPHEIEGVAYQCEYHNGLHISSDCVHLEIVDEDHHGVPVDTPGHIVLTDLEHLTLPLIRYKIGDIGCLLSSHCECGRSFPLMSDILGRNRDRFTGNNNTYIPATTISSALQDLEELTLFQVFQNKEGEILFLLPPGDRDLLQLIKPKCSQILTALLGKETTIKYSADRPLTLEKNGKFIFAKGCY